MKMVKNLFLWSLPVIVPLLAITSYEFYIFYTPPGILSERNADGSYETIEPFELISQEKESFNSDKLEGEYYLANFFFISCPDICPRMNNQMEEFYHKFARSDNFRLVSFTVNPEYDTPEKLQEYATNLNVSYPDWVFLTGDKREIYRLARNSFRVSAAEGDGGPDGFIHSELLILVDDQGRLRGFYESSDNTEMRRLKKDLELLLDNDKKLAS